MNLDVSNDIYRNIYDNIHIIVKWKKKLLGRKWTCKSDVKEYIKKVTLKTGTAHYRAKKGKVIPNNSDTASHL